MSNFPNSLDTDIELPRVDGNITEIGGEAINGLRDATLAIETEIGFGVDGYGASGTAGNIAERLNVSLLPDGSIKPSILIGLISSIGGITNSQISATAGIQESKLNLDYSTSSLYALASLLKSSVDVLNGFLSLTGIKVEPHIDGTNFNHLLSHIHIGTPTEFLNKNGAIRNTTNADTLVQDMNNDFVSHQKSMGAGTPAVPPGNFAHNAAGININPSNFSTIPQTIDNLQDFAEYTDSNSLSLLGSRTQNLFSNGISRSARSTSFTSDGYFSGEFGATVVPPTVATAYLNAAPTDSIDSGDDVVLFSSDASAPSNNVFDAQFSAVKSGDILTINYGSLITSFVIDSVKSLFTNTSKVYAVRINGKNLAATTTAIAKITKPQYNENKYGVLATAAANNSISDTYGSLIVGNPRSAQALGLGFNANKIDATHYNLYLTLYPTGAPSDKLINLPPIDITGNLGATPGAYTLDSVINTVNSAFRRNGYNYRFIAFSYKGDFGIMLADHFNNVSFSVISGSTDGYGNYTNSSLSSFPNNVVDLFSGNDALGFLTVASPPYSAAYTTPYAAQNPTKIFYPLKKNFYYVNGLEKDKLKQEPLTLLDTYGDGYWPATITAKNSLSGRVEVSYTINLCLNTSGLKVGKTIVVQPEFDITGNNYSLVDYGRFIISDITFDVCNPNASQTIIKVYDGIHGTGISPYVSSVNIPVRLYFSNDSVEFDRENVSDGYLAGNYKRYFETYIDGTKDENGHTFTHERARFISSGSDITAINFYRVSPKLTGYKNGFSNAQPNVIRLNISSFDGTTGIYSGFLSNTDGSSPGPVTTGKQGEIVRFIDANVDYIDFTFANISMPSFTNKTLDIDLYPTLSLDEEVMMIGSCQVNDNDKVVSYVRDDRRFGNVSEKHLSTSAIDFITSGDRALHQNGVIRGFDIFSITGNTVSISGGSVLVNGSIVNMNLANVKIPLIQETYLSTVYTKINWLLGVSNNEFSLIPLTDYDATSPATPNAARTFTARNPVNSSTYTINSRTFQEVLELRKDFTPLYKLTSIVDNTGALTSLTKNDARKFCFESDAITYPVLTSEGSQGNFYSFDSLAIWLTYNSKYFTNVGIKGNFTITGTYSLSSNYVVKLNGNNVSTLTFATGSNVVFNNFHFNELPIVINSGANITFNNCIFDPTSLTINSGATVSVDNVIFDDCNIILNQALTITNGGKLKNSTINVNSASGISISGDRIIFDDCSVVYNATSGTGVAISITGTGNALLNNNVFDQGLGTFSSSLLVCSAPAILKNNIFKGIKNNLNNPMVSFDTNALLSNNYFYRDAMSLGTGSYIQLNDGYCSVVNNFFDSHTVDGSNEELLVITGNAKAVYEKNKNQTAYVAIPISNSTLTYSGSGNSTTATLFLYGSSGGASSVSGINVVSVGLLGTYAATYVVKLTDYIPDSVNIISCVTGLVLSGSTPDLGNCSFSLSFGEYITSKYNSTSSATLLNSLLDVKNISNIGTVTESAITYSSSSNTLTIGSGGISATAFQGATQYIKIEDINFYKNNNMINAAFNINVANSAINTTSTITVSPLAIKYRW